jgi:hypothetical protein
MNPEIRATHAADRQEVPNRRFCRVKREPIVSAGPVRLIVYRVDKRAMPSARLSIDNIVLPMGQWAVIDNCGGAGIVYEFPVAGKR